LVFHSDGQAEDLSQADRSLRRFSYSFIDDSTVELRLPPEAVAEVRSFRVQVQFPSRDELVLVTPAGRQTLRRVK
jgi:hypothetical protein